MLLVGLFAGFLCLLMVLGDWLHFTRLTASAGRYGCGVGREEDRLPGSSSAEVLGRFDPHGVLSLPHGIARLFRPDNMILLRPHYRLFSFRFRTAWPIKGSIDVKEDGDACLLLCVKRIPWSSAIITAAWFALVGLGTIGFAVIYVLQEGLASVGSVLLGLSVIGVGVMVFGFGLITVVVAYRLENGRLRQAYQELRDALGHHGEAS